MPGTNYMRHLMRIGTSAKATSDSCIPPSYAMQISEQSEASFLKINVRSTSHRKSMCAIDQMSASQNLLFLNSNQFSDR